MHSIVSSVHDFVRMDLLKMVTGFNIMSNIYFTVLFYQCGLCEKKIPVISPKPVIMDLDISYSSYGKDNETEDAQSGKR